MGLKKPQLDTKIQVYLPDDVMQEIRTLAKPLKLTPGRFVKDVLLDLFTPTNKGN